MTTIIIKLYKLSFLLINVNTEIINMENLNELNKFLEKNIQSLIICDSRIFYNTQFYNKNNISNNNKISNNPLNNKNNKSYKTKIELKSPEHKNVLCDLLKKYENFYLIYTGSNIPEPLIELTNSNKNNNMYLLIKKGTKNPYIFNNKIIIDYFIRHEVIIFFLILYKKINMKNKKIIYITYNDKIFRTIHNEEIIWIIIKNNKKQDNNKNNINHN